MTPRTAEALRLLRSGLSWRKAAQQAGVHQSTILRAIRRQQRKEKRQ